MNRFRFAIGVWLLIPCLVLALADARADDDIESVRRLATEWTRLRVDTQKLEADWQRERTLLQSSLSALAERVTTLEQRRTTVEAETAGTRGEIAALQARNAKAVAALAETEVRVQAIATELIRLRASLPPRLSTALEMPYRTLGESGRGTGERMQVVASIVGRCLQFNRSVSFSEEVLTGPAVDPERVVEVVYWGMAEAYALDRTRGRAFLGHPGETGWIWEARDDAAGQVLWLIETYKKSSEPAFARVPAQISEISGTGTQP